MAAVAVNPVLVRFPVRAAVIGGKYYIPAMLAHFWSDHVFSFSSFGELLASSSAGMMVGASSMLSRKLFVS